MDGLTIDSITSSAAVLEQLEQPEVTLSNIESVREIMEDSIEKRVYFIGSANAVVVTNPHVDILLQQFNSTYRVHHESEAGAPSVESFSVEKVRSLLPARFRTKVTVIIYQTRGVDTGGTVALNSLYETLLKLGYNVTRCWNDNHLSHECTNLMGICYLIC